MAEKITIRIHDDFEGDVASIKEWCAANASSLNSVFNSFLPAIASAITNQVYEDDNTGKRFVRADFGDLMLREPHDYRNYRADTYQ
jgi:hypothetical protein